MESCLLSNKKMKLLKYRMCMILKYTIQIKPDPKDYIKDWRDSSELSSLTALS